MLKEIYSTYVKSAQGLGNYDTLTKTELANGYCDADEAGDEIKKSQYFSALMLRYWFKVYDFYRTSRSTQLQIDDFTSWVSEALSLGLKYRRWRDVTNPLSQDPNGPDKVFNRCFITIRLRWYKYFSQQVRKANYQQDSIEEQVEKFGDNATIFIQTAEGLQLPTVSQQLVQLYLNKGKILTALIIDGIAHGDAFIFKNKTANIGAEFSQRKLAKHLRTLDEKYLNYFESVYRVDNKNLQAAIIKLNKLPSGKLYTYIEDTLNKIRTNKEVLSLLAS